MPNNYRMDDSQESTLQTSAEKPDVEIAKNNSSRPESQNEEMSSKNDAADGEETHNGVVDTETNETPVESARAGHDDREDCDSIEHQQGNDVHVDNDESEEKDISLEPVANEDTDTVKETEPDVTTDQRQEPTTIDRDENGGPNNSVEPIEAPADVVDFPAEDTEVIHPGEQSDDLVDEQKGGADLSATIDEHETSKSDLVDEHTGRGDLSETIDERTSSEDVANPEESPPEPPAESENKKPESPEPEQEKEQTEQAEEVETASTFDEVKRETSPEVIQCADEGNATNLADDDDADVIATSSLQDKGAEREAFQKLIDENTALEHEITRLKSEIQMKDDKIKELESELDIVRDELNGLRGSGDRSVNDQVEASDREKDLQDKLDTTSADKSDLEQKITDLQLRLKRFALDDEEKDKRILLLEGELSNASAKAEQLERSLEEERVKHANGVNNGASGGHEEPRQRTRQSGVCNIL
ncbi:uncharacterized protein LOC141901953 [Tubulanus polymorphus]|uniref:uncharacterized protein LOC141901953 n=1 Tax=Tubulanus polymorphus TaxID=672921 RepID=UPI003DA4E201